MNFVSIVFIILSKNSQKIYIETSSLIHVWCFVLHFYTPSQADEKRIILTYLTRNWVMQSRDFVLKSGQFKFESWFVNDSLLQYCSLSLYFCTLYFFLCTYSTPSYKTIRQQHNYEIYKRYAEDHTQSATIHSNNTHVCVARLL